MNENYIEKMNFVLKKSERENHIFNGKTIIFRWTVSRGRETFGYNILSLYLNGKKCFSCSGGGYDMRGQCLGKFIKDNFLEELKKIKGEDFSRPSSTGGFCGLSFYAKRNGKIVFFDRYRPGSAISVDGSCGFSSMERILNKIGFDLKFIADNKNSEIYLISACDTSKKGK